MTEPTESELVAELVSALKTQDTVLGAMNRISAWIELVRDPSERGIQTTEVVEH